MFAEMEEKIAQIPPGCNGVMALGLLGGSSMPLDGVLRGLWMGYDWSHKKEHFYRALLESFTYDFSLAICSIERLYPEYKLDTVRIIGGGAKSQVWPQMCADVQGKAYHVLNREDVAMWGAALLAGNAIGVFGDLKETANAHVKVQKEFRPDPEKKVVYAKYMGLYEQYMVELHDFFERLQAIQ
jgi:xylulokinase